MERIVVALILAGCAGTPTVPPRLLQHVPPAAIERIEPLEQRLVALDQQISAKQAELEDARQREDAHAERVELARKRLQADQRLKELAVEQGDAPGAGTADERAAAAAVLVEHAEAELFQATAQRERVEAELELLEAERALTAAHIERERARAVAASVEGFDLRPYERAVRDAARRRENAQRRVIDVGGRPSG